MIAEVERILRSIAAVEGVTTAAGTVNTVVDAALPYPTAGADYWNGRVLVMLAGVAKGETAVIVDDDGAGTLTLRPALRAAPGITKPYIILNRINDMTPTADSDENYQTRDVVGNKEDAAALDTMADLTTDTIVAEVKRVLLRLSTDAFLAHIQGADYVELDKMMAQMALYFDAAGDALSVTMNPGAGARASLELILQDLADMLAGGPGIVTFPDPAAPANGVSVAEVIHQIYDDLAAVETKLDTGGLGSGLVTKALTFANNNGQVNLFTVTGDVIVRIIAVVKTNCASGGCDVSVGIAADVDAIIPVTNITLLAAQEIWFDATPDSEIEALGTMREHIVSDGNDITLNSSAADNSGAITFYCFWTALSTGATVVAA